MPLGTAVSKEVEPDGLAELDEEEPDPSGWACGSGAAGCSGVAGGKAVAGGIRVVGVEVDVSGGVSLRPDEPVSGAAAAGGTEFCRGAAVVGAGVVLAGAGGVCVCGCGAVAGGLDDWASAGPATVIASAAPAINHRIVRIRPT